MDTSEDGLAAEAEGLVGRLLRFTPVYGWGWFANEGSEPIPPEGPPPFHARLIRIFSFQGIRRGGVARIEEKSHPYEAHFVVFSTRTVGHYDLRVASGAYNVGIYPREPVDDVAGWPIAPKGTHSCTGYADPVVLECGE